MSDIVERLRKIDEAISFGIITEDMLDDTICIEAAIKLTKPTTNE